MNVKVGPASIKEVWHSVTQLFAEIYNCYFIIYTKLHGHFNTHKGKKRWRSPKMIHKNQSQHSYSFKLSIQTKRRVWKPWSYLLYLSLTESHENPPSAKELSQKPFSLEASPRSHVHSHPYGLSCEYHLSIYFLSVTPVIQHQQK